jgi:hypothetical protein
VGTLCTTKSTGGLMLMLLLALPQEHLKDDKRRRVDGRGGINEYSASRGVPPMHPGRCQRCYAQ